MAVVDPDIKLIMPDFGPRERSRGRGATPQSKADAGAGIFEELGRTGLRHWGGFIFEEWLRELQSGRRAAEVYREMGDSDPVIGGMLYAIEMLCRRVDWWFEPGGSTQADRLYAEWSNSNLHDMNHSWTDVVAEILSFLQYGWSYFEMVFKQRLGPNQDDGALRSQFDDGTIGLRKLSIRSQDSLWKWAFDDNDGIAGLIQNPPPDYQMRFIPIEKALLFRTRVSKNNPEGRALAADTPVPTPDGWKRISDLAAGDKVYDELGRIRYVTGSATWEDRPCFEVVFSSGHSIVADANHLWEVSTHNDRTKGRRRTLSTEEMYEASQIARQCYSAGIAATLDGTSGVLPVDPYLLGYWLGDGTRSNGSIACPSEDFANLRRQAESAGHMAAHDGDIRASITGLRERLRTLEVIGNKHVPRSYLRAAHDDRLSLLQGLMDSDGTVDRDGGLRFYNTDERIVGPVEELVRSLGGVPRRSIACRPGHSGGIVNGRSVVATRTLYCVTFSLPYVAFRLPRKAERQPLRTGNRTQGHNIREISPVESRRTVCIEVDGPSHLFLAGEGMVPTHNSVLRSSYRPWYFKKNIENIEGIGLERDLAGLPVLKAPPNTDIWDANDTTMSALRLQAQNVVSSIRRDEQEGVLLPDGWELTLLSTGGRRQFDTNAVITRYDNRIATSILLDVILLGQDKVGSYALAGVKKGLFTASLEAYLDQISSVWDSFATPRLFKVNNFQGYTKLPQLKHGTVEQVDLETLGNYLQKLAGAGAPLFGNDAEDKLMNYLLDSAGLPKIEPSM